MLGAPVHEAQSLPSVLRKKENLSTFRSKLRGKPFILHLHSDQQKPGSLGLKQHLLQTTLVLLTPWPARSCAPGRTAHPQGSSI